MRTAEIVKHILLLFLLFTTLSFQLANYSCVVANEKNLISTGLSEDFKPNSDLAIAYQAGQKEEQLNLRVEFIGFNQSVINEAEIENQLYSTFDSWIDVPHSEFDFNFEFSYASESERAALESYIQSIAVNGTGTGYKINTTLLIEDLLSGERSNIFLPIDGMSIDADLVEEYFYQNFYEEPPADKPGYTFYILNFTKFDTLDHSLEHWYDVSEISSDSNETTTWWYSGYGNLPKRAAAGWGGKHRFCYLDLSARTWFFDFIEIAWGGYFDLGDVSYYDYQDLDELTQTFDPRTSEGEEKLAEYIADWINSYTGNVFSGPLIGLPLGESVSLQVKVFNNLTDNGYPEEDLKWCISEYRILNQLEQDFPWINWHVNVEWVELEEYPDLFNYIQQNLQVDQDGAYIEVSEGLFDILESQLNDHFDMNAGDVVLPAYLFINDQIGFKWLGVPFSGLGGMGWEILVRNQNSLFESGNISEPRRGVSETMTHELGHSLGLPHPHSGPYAWGSAFVDDTMSYFATTLGFSTFYQDSIGRAHTDAYYLYSQEELVEATTLFQEADEPEELEETMNQINSLLEDVPIYYQQMDYNASVYVAREARELINYVINYLGSPSTEPSTESTTSSKTGINVCFLVILPSTLTIIAVIARKRRGHK